MNPYRVAHFQRRVAWASTLVGVVLLLPALVIGSPLDNVSVPGVNVRFKKIIAKSSGARRQAHLSMFMTGVMQTVKCQWDVNLSRKLTHTELTDLSITLQNTGQDPSFDPACPSQSYSLFPKGWRRSAGPWATITFDGDRVVSHVELTYDEEQAAAGKGDPASVVGRWRDDRPRPPLFLWCPSELFIYRDGEWLKLIRSYRNGARHPFYLKEQEVDGIVRLIPQGIGENGHFVIQPSGNLDMFEPEGLLGTARRVK